MQTLLAERNVTASMTDEGHIIVTVRDPYHPRTWCEAAISNGNDRYSDMRAAILDQIKAYAEMAKHDQSFDHASIAQMAYHIPDLFQAYNLLDEEVIAAIEDYDLHPVSYGEVYAYLRSNPRGVDIAKRINY